MAATSSTTPSKIMNATQIERGIKRIQKVLDALYVFDPYEISQSDPRAHTRPLISAIQNALAETFDQETAEYIRFYPATNLSWGMSNNYNHQTKIANLRKAKTRSVQLLESALELLRERHDILAEEQNADHHVANPPKNLSNRIFIVHGQDDGPKEAVARFVASLGYQPIILHELASKGRTIIQKFQDEASDVGFAIVLMTPDDETSTGQKRARQNVILELGFFLGALGPDRVAAIMKSNLETPSDFDGVVYIPYEGAWKMDVAKELEAAGYEVDWNTVMRG